MKSDILYWLWYSRVRGLTIEVKLKLLEHVASPEYLFKGADKNLPDYIAPEIKRTLKEQATLANLERYVRIAERQDYQITTYFDYEYPEMLTQIDKPPLVLFYKGNLDCLKRRCIAVVGTRRASEKGLYHARSFSREFAGNGFTVVSGLARGIDSAAHIGAMSTGVTCAVLGCGVDVVYPPENREIYEAICQEGAVISEYLPGVQPRKWHFPQRNRIISGLSESVVLIEAPERSGALNTINHAVEQNRDVYVLSDRLEAYECAGNRMLLEEGAVPVTTPYDIIESDSFTAYDGVQSLKKPREENIKEDKKEYHSFSEPEAKLMKAIRKGKKQFDEIILESGLKASEAGYLLTMLEFKGIIRQMPGKVYEER